MWESPVIKYKQVSLKNLFIFDALHWHKYIRFRLYQSFHMYWSDENVAKRFLAMKLWTLFLIEQVSV